MALFFLPLQAFLLQRCPLLLPAQSLLLLPFSLLLLLPSPLCGVKFFLLAQVFFRNRFFPLPRPLSLQFHPFLSLPRRDELQILPLLLQLQTLHLSHEHRSSHFHLNLLVILCCCRPILQPVVPPPRASPPTHNPSVVSYLLLLPPRNTINKIEATRRRCITGSTYLSSLAQCISVPNLTHIFLLHTSVDVRHRIRVHYVGRQTRNEFRKLYLTHTLLLAPFPCRLLVSAGVRLLTESREILAPPPQTL